jgi:hypothetical protein
MFQPRLIADIEGIERTITWSFKFLAVYVLIKVPLGARDYELYLIVFERVKEIFGMQASRWRK